MNSDINAIRLVVFAFAISGCGDLIAPEAGTSGIPSTEDAVYFTSFESDTDTSGWEGYGFGLMNDAPAGGEKRSMEVSGGCIWPHGQLHLKPLDRDSRLILRCWGKNLGIGGGISLQADGNHGTGIHITIEDTVWRAYESADTLSCPAGTVLELSVGAGGIVWSAMLIDLIEIRCVQ